MGNCPINSNLSDQLLSLSDELYKYLKTQKADENFSLASDAYNALGVIISEIFTEDFFYYLDQAVDISGKGIGEAHKEFSRVGLTYLMNFFSNERKKGRTFPGIKGTKLFPNTSEEIIIMGWQHACFLIGLFLSRVLESSNKEGESTKDFEEAKRLTMILARTHLFIETSVVRDIESIFERGAINTESIYYGIENTEGFDLPALGCPAVFFGDKRVGKSLFECMKRKMEEAYGPKSQNGLSRKCPIYKIRLFIFSILDRLN